MQVLASCSDPFVRSRFFPFLTLIYPLNFSHHFFPFLRPRQTPLPPSSYVHDRCLTVSVSFAGYFVCAATSFFSSVQSTECLLSPDLPPSLASSWARCSFLYSFPSPPPRTLALGSRISFPSPFAVLLFPVAHLSVNNNTFFCFFSEIFFASRYFHGRQVAWLLSFPHRRRRSFPPPSFLLSSTVTV